MVKFRTPKHPKSSQQPNQCQVQKHDINQTPSQLQSSENKQTSAVSPKRQELASMPLAVLPIHLNPSFKLKVSQLNQTPTKQCRFQRCWWSPEVAKASQKRLPKRPPAMMPRKGSHRWPPGCDRQPIAKRQTKCYNQVPPSQNSQKGRSG